MTTTLPARIDTLDPLQRADFDQRPVREWRVTWPDGTSETMRGHWVQMAAGSDGAGTCTFGWVYLGPYRVINLAHVRDIAEVAAEAAR